MKKYTATLPIGTVIGTGGQALEFDIEDETLLPGRATAVSHDADLGNGGLLRTYAVSSAGYVTIYIRNDGDPITLVDAPLDIHVVVFDA